MAKDNDERTPWAAFAKVVEAIGGTPKDSWITDVTIGRRHADVGGGWYWNVTWAMSSGTVDGGYHTGTDKAVAYEKAAIQLIECTPRMDTCPVCGAIKVPNHYHPTEDEE